VQAYRGTCRVLSACAGLLESLNNGSRVLQETRVVAGTRLPEACGASGAEVAGEW
jgi:hypothetical protein